MGNCTALALSDSDYTQRCRLKYSWLQKKTVWYAIFGCDDLFTLSNSGTVEVLDDGTTIFKEKEDGKHYYIRLSKDNEYVESKIDYVLEGGIINV